MSISRPVRNTLIGYKKRNADLRYAVHIG